mgnify:CR=1 FL=1
MMRAVSDQVTKSATTGQKVNINIIREASEQLVEPPSNKEFIPSTVLRAFRSE